MYVYVYTQTYCKQFFNLCLRVTCWYNHSNLLFPMEIKVTFYEIIKK